MDLATFLERLGQDPQLRRQFVADPAGISKQHGLSTAEIEALRTDDQSALDRVLQTKDKIAWIVVAEWIIKK